VGYLDRLWRTPEGLRFAGVLEDEAMTERLRRERGLAVSSESARKFPRNPFTPSKPPPPGFLFAVAILPDGEDPAYPGSILLESFA
jgi:hypothetical protein